MQGARALRAGGNDLAGSGLVSVADRDGFGQDWLDRYSLLASALAGRRMALRWSGGVGYCDGETIVLPADQREDALLTLMVQASLVASGSLDPRILDRLVGQRQATIRYFSLEVARAAGPGNRRLPRSFARAIGDHRIDRVPASPEEALERAFSREPIPLPPESFGSIRPMKLLRGASLGDGAAPQPGDFKSTMRESSMPEVEDDDEAGELKLLKLLSSPVGSPAPLAEMLQRLFGGGRRRREDAASGGAEIPVASRSAVNRVGSRAKLIPRFLGLKFPSKVAARVDGVYPEWDWELRRYRPEWCSVTEYDTPHTSVDNPIKRIGDSDLRRRLARIGLALERHRRQADGDALDLDPLVDLVVGRAMGESGDERIYQSRRKTAHDLGVLLLLDASGSTGEHDGVGPRTFDEQRQLTSNLAVALEEIGDRVAVFGFNSQGRHAVQFHRVKDFDDRYDQPAHRRLGALEPAGYTRLGAAVRHGLHVLDKKSGAAHRVLVVISDGFPFDDSYEDTYAERDTRQALAEGRFAGIGVICLSVAASTRPDALERVFGSSAYAHLARASDLNEHIEDLLRAAVRTASGTQRTEAGRTRHKGDGQEGLWAS